MEWKRDYAVDEVGKNANDDRKGVKNVKLTRQAHAQLDENH